MPGFVSSISNKNDAVFAKNADFSLAGDPSSQNGLITDGQLWIGHTDANLDAQHVFVGNLTSPNNTITIGYASPNITIDLVGGTAAVEHLTADSGGQLNPTANNFNLLGSGSITTVGSGSTITTELTGLTNHNVLIGAGTQTITKVPPSATSGIPLISQGASADPLFGTAVVAGGGTGQVTLTNHGVLVGAGTSAISQTAAGSAGQVLQSSGASADPVYSTATYPATAGTSGNVLTSDGTNWVSSAPQQIFNVTGQLTSLQIKSINATPIQLVAAPGLNKAINVISFSSSYVYGGTNVFTAGVAQFVGVYFNLSTLQLQAITNTTLVGTASGFTINRPSTLSFTTTANYSNSPLNFYNSNATEISGNAANDNLMNWSLTYSIVPT